MKTILCRTVLVGMLMLAVLFTGAGAHLPGAGLSAAEVIPEILKEKLDRRIALDLRDMDTVDVYKFLAVKGDFNVTISKNVAGRVTLYIHNVSIKDALDIISIANALAYKVVGDNIVYIMTEAEYMALYGRRFSDETKMKIVYLKYAKPAYALEALKNIKSEIGRIVIDEDTGSVVMIDTQEKLDEMTRAIEQMDHTLETRVFTLQYGNAEDIATKLKEKIDNKAVGSVQGDARSNQLIVRALPDRMTEVEAIVKALDRKTKAVLIEARVLKLILNPKLDAGLNWDAVFRQSGKLMFKGLEFTGAFPIASAISSATSLGTVGKMSVGQFGQDDFALELKMLKQVLETKVLANPSIMVLNNKEARIHIGDKLAYVTTTTIGTGESQRVNEEIHYIDVGVQLKVIPTINDDGFITMEIKPEISSQSSTLTTPQGAKVPLINTTLVETSVIVKDSQTIIIGGLMQDTLAKSRQGVPYLMDAPLIGGAFANISKEKNKTEIVILLTPHIIAGDENYADRRFEMENNLKPDKEY